MFVYDVFLTARWLDDTYFRVNYIWHICVEGVSFHDQSRYIHLMRLVVLKSWAKYAVKRQWPSKMLIMMDKSVTGKVESSVTSSKSMYPIFLNIKCLWVLLRLCHRGLTNSIHFIRQSQKLVGNSTSLSQTTQQGSMNRGWIVPDRMLASEEHSWRVGWGRIAWWHPC